MAVIQDGKGFWTNEDPPSYYPTHFHTFIEIYIEYRYPGGHMKIETKVGLLGVGAMAFVALFAYYLGLVDPFSGGRELKVMYNYAGGIEEGSPVRVMGIKVGKVKNRASFCLPKISK